MRRRLRPARPFAVACVALVVEASGGRGVALGKPPPPSAPNFNSSATQSPASEGPASSPPPSSPPPPNAPLADPLVRADAELAARRATAWRRGRARFVLLQGDVRFRVGAYGFRAHQALVRIDTFQSPGRRIHDLAIYLDHARSLHSGGMVSAQAPRMLVTVATQGKVKLATDYLKRLDRAPRQPIVTRGLRRIAHRRRTQRRPTLTAPRGPLHPPPSRGQPAHTGSPKRQAEATGTPPHRAAPRPRPNASSPPAAVAEQSRAPQTAPSARGGVARASRGLKRSPVLPTRGTVYLSADRIAGSGKRHALMLIGNVRVVYRDRRRQSSTALTADRVVLFTHGNVARDAAAHKLSASSIQGVYLERNAIITSGRFTVRAPRMYFDLRRNKAILLKAVAYTFDVRRHIPLYLRARVIRQTSAKSLQASDALLTTSEFAKPLFAIASDKVTIQRLPEGEGGPVERFTASGNVVKAAGLPIFYWPYLAGENRESPLRSIGLDYSSQNGPELTTTFGLFALAGQPRPRGVDLLLRADYRGHHGPATGVRLRYHRDKFFGNLDSYLLPFDNGTDKLTDNREVGHDHDTRGFIHWQHRQQLQQGFELSLETSYLSDDTFLEEFFPGQAYQAREYQTDAYLKKQKDDWALTLLAKYNLNDFTPQLTTLQTPGYTVDKLPELGYYRVGASLWDDRLTWFSENRLSRLRIRAGTDTPGDRGFGFDAFPIFGIAPDQSFADAADAAGVPRGWRYRLDTRQEIDAPLTVGVFDVTPYVAGRLTAYDQGFNDFSGEGRQARLWGAVGTRLHTQFHRTWDFQSQLLDVHRLRHIIEPRVDAFVQGATLDAEQLPVYDQNVENIGDGPGLRLGLTNTLQTQRGGPGRWRDVDWITLRTDLVLLDNHGQDRGRDPAGRLPRFIDYRPEFSTGGDHFYSQLLWMVSDTFGVSGDLTYDFQAHRLAQWRLRGSLQHTPRLRSFVDYEQIEPLDLRLISYGFTYQLTTKYRLAFRQRFDLAGGGSRDLSFSLERRLPHWLLRLVGDYDQIDGDTTFGLVLVPQGLGGASSSSLPFDQGASPF